MKKFLLVLSASLPLSALADTVDVNIPGTENVATGGPGAIVANFYQFAMMIGGILAFGMIVWGGVLYVAARGNSSAIENARKKIYGALIGLALLLGVYLILNVINPGLLSLQIGVGPTCRGQSFGTCPPNSSSTCQYSTATASYSCVTACGGAHFGACGGPESSCQQDANLNYQCVSKTRYGTCQGQTYGTCTDTGRICQLDKFATYQCVPKADCGGDTYGKCSNPKGEACVADLATKSYDCKPPSAFQPCAADTYGICAKGEVCQISDTGGFTHYDCIFSTKLCAKDACTFRTERCHGETPGYCSDPRSETCAMDPLARQYECRPPVED